MKRFLIPSVIFFSVFFLYFFVGTKYTFRPKWALDYFNPLAKSILNFQLDIPSPATTYDLSNFRGKWYGPWGIIPAIFLIPLQLLKGRYIPLFYLSIFFSSLNTVIMYYLLKRIKRDFLPHLSSFGINLTLLLFAFGTTQFYVGTLGSTWHVDQISTSFLGILGIYFIFRKERKFVHYFASITCFSFALLGRPTISLLSILPVSFYVYDLTIGKKKVNLKEIFFLLIPLFIFSSAFFLYNYIRFNNGLEYGFTYIHESPYLAKIREKNGAFSFANVSQNLWYMVFEMPGIDLNKLKLSFNLNGNSIFFLTPPFLTSFLTFKFLRKNNKFIFNPYIIFLWIASVMTILPSLMHYGSGWMQFGYRFSLDINVLLVLLSIFGIKGKISLLYLLGTVFSIIMYVIGINALM